MSVERAREDEEGLFPVMLSSFLATIRNGMTPSPLLNAILAEKTIDLLIPYLARLGDDEIDEDVEAVLKAAIKRYLRIVTEGPTKMGQGSGTEKIEAMSAKLIEQGKVRESNTLLELAAEVNPSKNSQALSGKMSWKQAMRMGLL